METHEHSEQAETSLFQMNISIQNNMNLRSAASWARVLGVCGMVVGSVISLMSIYFFIRISSLESSYSGSEGILSNLVGVTRGAIAFYVIIGGIFIVGGVFALSFGNRVLAALQANDEAGLDSGFGSLRNYFATRGIVMIVLVVLIILAFLGAAM
jgi:hypothetical protein